MQNLTGKRALVTGGGVGIGRGVVSALASAGASVAFTYLSHEPEREFVEATAAASGGPCIPLRVDATEESQVTQAVSSAVEALGGVDILVNNVGGLIERVQIAEMDLSFWHRVMGVNLDSMFLTTREVLRHLDGGWGRIVNVASLAGHNGGSAGSTAYATAKSGMFGFTRGLAKEVAGGGITVNAVAPGLILDTPFHETFTPVENQRASIETIALKRAGLPADVAGPVLWLCSEASSFVTGAVIDINGGQYFV